MGVKVWLPCGSFTGIDVMPLVPVDKYLQWCDSPTFLTHLAEMLQLLHRGVFLDYDNPLLDWRAAPYYGHLSRLFVHLFPVFCLHRPTCLLLDHCGYLPVAFFERGFAQFRCYPFLVFRHEVSTDVYLFLADIGEIFRSPPVMRSAASHIAGLYVD